MSSKVSDEIYRRLAEKIDVDEQRTRCGRIDMELADYEPLGPNEAKIMVEYAKERGVPTGQQLNEWVTATFGGRLLLSADTLRNHGDLCAFVGIVRQINAPMPFSRSAGMMRLGGGRFADAGGNTWATEVSPDGQKYLTRVSSDPIEAILEEKISRQRSGRYARLDLSMVRTAGTITLDEGDTVAYTTPDGGGVQQFGKVTGIGKDWVTISNHEGQLAKSYVVDIVEKSAAARKKQNAFLTDFWKKWLFAGKNFGDQMTVKD